MKKALIIILTVLAGCQVQKKQVVTNNVRPLSDFKKDTVAYLRYNFVINKDKYVGKQVNVLYQDLKMPIKFFALNNNKNHNATTISFYFCNSDEVFNRAFDPSLFRLIVHVKDEMPESVTLPIRRQDRQDFSKAMQDYLGKQIIADIDPMITFKK